MVLAQGEELDILDHDHLVSLLGEDGVPDDLLHGLLVTLGEVGHGLGRPHGGLQQPLPGRVLAHRLQDVPVVGGQQRQQLLPVNLLLLQASITVAKNNGLMILKVLSKVCGDHHNI